MNHDVTVSEKEIQLTIVDERGSCWQAKTANVGTNQEIAELLGAMIAEVGPTLDSHRIRQIRALIHKGRCDLPAKEVKVVRDTETGEFAPKEQAKKDPKGTVTETVKKKRK